MKKRVSSRLFDERLAKREYPYGSGVWRYKELILDIKNEFIVSRPEGNTNLYQADKVGKYTGIKNIRLKHEGENPTASFKDRGMSCAISVAKMLGFKKVACASTGNTSASMASYADLADMRKKYDPAKLTDGFNTVDGEKIFYISNPAIGLWSYKERFKQ